MSRAPGLDTTLAANDGAADARKAALLLHALAPAERRWFIERLPQEHARILKPLLAELEALGMPGDAGLVRELLSTAPPIAAAAAPAAVPVDPWALVDGVDPLFMARMLSVEPPRLIADVVRLRHWSWASSTLTALSPVKRERVEALIEQAAPPDSERPADGGDPGFGQRRDAMLLELLKQRCARAQRAPSDPPRRPAVRRRAPRLHTGSFARWIGWFS